ncbi:MAG: DNA mismatch repair protein MutS [Gemmataceae bacterium]
MISVAPALDRAQTGPRDEFTRRLEVAREAKVRQEKIEAILGNAKVLIFFAGLVLVYLAFVPQLFSPYWLLLAGLIFILVSVGRERADAALRNAQRRIDFYERCLDRLDDHWAGKGQPGTSYADENHPYALNLDLFGTGSLFERLCTTRTEIGANTLAGWLKGPAEPAVARARNEAVDDLRPRLDVREQLCSVGDSVHANLDALVAWGKAERVLPAPWTRWLAVPLVIATVTTLALWLSGDILNTPLVLALGAQGAFAWWLSKRVQQVVAPVERRAHDLALFAGILARIESEKFTSARLLDLQGRLGKEGQRPSQHIARLQHLVQWLECTHNPYFGFAAMIVLFKTQLAYGFEGWRLRFGPAIGGWLDVIGEFEALLAFSAFAYENPDDAYAELIEEGACFEGEQLGHPLLPASRCIRNDVHLGMPGDLRVLVVSGSNMSGKSTLLRTVGVNTVLALAGAPVRASKLRVSPCAIGATLRIQDSLQAGKSRFFAEISRIRQLVDISKGPLPLLFLLDEILHGTNSHDRKIGAEAIVRALLEAGAIGLLTTHDLALTHIAEQLAPRAVNVHFADTFEKGEIVFDYRLKPGVVQHSNALALMRAVGLQV